MRNNFVIIMVTCASRVEARRIADRILKMRLAACANIIDGIDSKFWWNNKIDHTSESLIIIKTRKSNFKKIESQIIKLHSYEVPEIIAIPIAAGSRNYLNWIGENVR